MFDWIANELFNYLLINVTSAKAALDRNSITEAQHGVV